MHVFEEIDVDRPISTTLYSYLLAIYIDYIKKYI